MRAPAGFLTVAAAIAQVIGGLRILPDASQDQVAARQVARAIGEELGETARALRGLTFESAAYMGVADHERRFETMQQAIVGWLSEGVTSKRIGATWLLLGVLLDVAGGLVALFGLR
jgi:hypothetical protein